MKRPTHIVVVDNGFVFAGVVETTATHLVLHGASIIRAWGTDRGLGQLPLCGPTPKTVLDPVAVTRVTAARRFETLTRIVFGEGAWPDFAFGGRHLAALVDSADEGVLARMVLEGLIEVSDV